MAELYNDQMFTKSDCRRIFHIKNDELTTSVDISGWTLSWMVKKYKDQADAAAILTKTTTGGAIVIGGSWNSDPDVNTQRATLTITDTDVATVPARLYHWELKRTDDGFEVPLVLGVIDIVDGVHD